MSGLRAVVAVDLGQGPVIDVGGLWRRVGPAVAGAGGKVVLLSGQQLVGQGDGEKMGVCRGQVVVVALWGPREELIPQVGEGAWGGGYQAASWGGCVAP